MTIVDMWFGVIALASPPMPEAPVAEGPSAEAGPTPEPDPPVAEGPSAEAGPIPEPDPSAESETPRSWQAELFVDTLYAFNSNMPANHVNRGMTTSPRTGELNVNTMGAFVRHRATDAEPWWIELGFHAGPAVDALVGPDPIPGGADGRYAGVEVFKHIALANAGVRIRKTKTSLGAGVFESPLGLSSFWTFRNSTYMPMWQNHIVPYYFSGARISQEVPGGLTLSGWVVNGAATYADANQVPSGVFSLMYSPPPRKGMAGLSVNSHVLFGPEGVDISPDDWYVLWDTTIVYDPISRFSIAAAWDFAMERPGRALAEQNLYTGGGLLLRGTAVDRPNVRFDLVVRQDVLWDRDGRFFGVPQWLITPTAGAHLRLWDHLLLRAEYRFDYSTATEGFFYRGDATTDGGPGLARTQHTLFLNLTGLWDFWFGRRGPEAG